MELWRELCGLEKLFFVQTLRLALEKEGYPKHEIATMNTELLVDTACNALSADVMEQVFQNLGFDTKNPDQRSGF